MPKVDPLDPPSNDKSLKINLHNLGFLGPIFVVFWAASSHKFNLVRICGVVLEINVIFFIYNSCKFQIINATFAKVKNTCMR